MQRIKKLNIDNSHHIQLRNQFTIFKYFFDCTIAIDKLFKVKYGEETKLMNSLPYFAFRDRFLIDTTEELKTFIDDKLNSFLDPLLEIESNISEIFEESVKSIVEIMNEKTRKLLDFNIEAKNEKIEFLLGEIDQVKQYILRDYGEFEGNLGKIPKFKVVKENRKVEEKEKIVVKVEKMEGGDQEGGDDEVKRKIDLIYRLSLFSNFFNIGTYPVPEKSEGKKYTLNFFLFVSFGKNFLLKNFSRSKNCCLWERYRIDLQPYRWDY